MASTTTLSISAFTLLAVETSRRVSFSFINRKTPTTTNSLAKFPADPARAGHSGCSSSIAFTWLFLRMTSRKQQFLYMSPSRDEGLIGTEYENNGNRIDSLV